MDIFESLEFEVRGTLHGRRYLDSFAGADALSYGHNNPFSSTQPSTFLVDAAEYMAGEPVT
jgi:4-aminobutyrate aminotransferase-like enzyme